MSKMCLLAFLVLLLARLCQPLRVCIYNDANFHGEVWPAFAYEFLQLGHNVSVFSNEGSFRMSDSITSWLPSKVRTPAEIRSSVCDFDVVVFVTMQMQPSDNRPNAFRVMGHMRSTCPAAHMETVKVFSVVHDLKLERRLYLAQP